MDDWEYHGDTMGQNWDERVWKFLETADLGVLDIFGQLHVFFFETWGEWTDPYLPGWIDGCELRITFMVNWSPQKMSYFTGYPLVNIQKTMENHHFSWENPL